MPPSGPRYVAPARFDGGVDLSECGNWSLVVELVTHPASSADWIADVRDCRNAWAQYVGDWIAERGYERARIGVAGLAGLSRSPDGIVAYGTMMGLQERFPHARVQLVRQERRVSLAGRLRAKVGELLALE